MSQNEDMMIPMTLDDIVRQNRHLITIRLSTPAEIMALRKNIAVPQDQIAKDEFEEWRIICLDRADAVGGPMHVLLGSAVQRSNLTTSPIIAIGNGYAITQSGSLYKIACGHGGGEPPVEHLICLCACLNSWGWGRGLGVPEFIF